MAAIRQIKRAIFLCLLLSAAATVFYAWNTSDRNYAGRKFLLSAKMASDLESELHAFSGQGIVDRLRNRPDSPGDADKGKGRDQDHGESRLTNQADPHLANQQSQADPHLASQQSQADTHRPNQLSPDDERVRQRFEDRLGLLHKACRTYGNTSLFRSKRAGYVPMPLYRAAMNISVRYCPIAKTAATTWTHHMAQIRSYMQRRGVEGTEDRSGAEDEIYFTFVREPYARMLSGYVDKLLTPNTLFWRITGRVIARYIRKRASNVSKACGHDATFPEFVKYVVFSQATGKFLNGHFIPTHDQCDMCTLPYRYIGQLETIKEDMPFITRAIRSPVNTTKTYDTDTIKQNAKMVLWEPRIKAVRKCMDLDEASRRLWKKYQIRGLISKREKFPYRRGAAVNITHEQFTRVALEAHRRSQRDPVGLKAQRQEALREAFSQVPLQDRLAAQKTLFLDFQMFGFDPVLKDVFPSTPYVQDKTFSYFSIYD